MAANSQGKSSSSFGMEEGGAVLLLMVALLIGVLWYLYHTQIVRASLHYSWFLSYPGAWIFMKEGATSSYPVTLITTISDLSHHPQDVSALEITVVLWEASLYLVPLMFFPIKWGMQAAKHPLKHINKLHEHWALMTIQSKTNPCIVPVVRFTDFWQRNKKDRAKSLFRAYMPDEFAKQHNLIKKLGSELLLDQEKSATVFVSQIGPLLNPSKMHKHKKALAVIFMTRIVFRGETGRENAKIMQDAINKSCNPDKAGDNYLSAFDFSCGKEFDKLFSDPKIQEIAKFFVHETTFMMRLLNEARKDGKLAPSEFIWLKLVDRKLWYTLYGVSKNLMAKAYVEAAGPFGQYWAAVSAMGAGQILEGYFTDESVRGLEKRLFDANMISSRLLVTDKERKREEEFGRIPEV